MLKNFITRLFTYPFCVFIIIIGYHMSFDTPNYSNPLYSVKAKFYGVPGIIIASVYLISDLAYQIKNTFFKNRN